MPSVSSQSSLAAKAVGGESRAQTEPSSQHSSSVHGSSGGERRKRQRGAACPMAKDLWPDRRFWGLVLQPKRGNIMQQAGKEQLVTREYHLHITQATLLLDANGSPREAAAARSQLWIANCNHGEAGKTEDRAPRLVCTLSASGRESQRLSIRLSGQRVKLIAVGQGCTLHLAGCLEHLHDDEEEEDDSDDMWSDGDSDGDSEIESSSVSDTTAGEEGGTQSGSQLSAMLASLDDSDSDDEDFSYPTSPARPDSPE